MEDDIEELVANPAGFLAKLVASVFEVLKRVMVTLIAVSVVTFILVEGGSAIALALMLMRNVFSK